MSTPCLTELCIFDLINLDTNRGNPKSGNGRRWFVEEMEADTTFSFSPPYTYRYGRKRFEFRAWTYGEALERMRTDKRTEHLVKSIWHREFNELICD